MNVTRKVKLFSGQYDFPKKGNAVEALQAWLDECDADPDNVYDIGEPIVFNGIHLLVMYNVIPAAMLPKREVICNVTCPSCGAGKKHYCRMCDAGATVG